MPPDALLSFTVTIMPPHAPPRPAVPEPTPTPTPISPRGLHIPIPAWLSGRNAVTAIMAAVMVWQNVVAPIAAEWTVEFHVPLTAHRRHPTPGPNPPPVPVPPNPAPIPGPPAPPAPTPAVTGILHVTYLAEKSEPPSQAAFKRNPAIEKALDGKSDVFHWYSLGESEPARLNLVPSDPAALPCVIFQREDGTIVKDATLHAPTADQIVAKVRELRGAK